MKSLAHWLSWSCSMNLGVAREHVRIARALRRMPTVRDAFRAGRLSYSKVREVTRVVDVVEEAQLCELALTATAAQLAVMISAFRSAEGRRIGQQARRQVTIAERDDGLVEIRARLPKEEAAIVAAALAAARDQFGSPPPSPGAADRQAEAVATPGYGQADALVDVARGFLATAPEDRSGEDRPLVVVHIDADLLAEPAASTGSSACGRRTAGGGRSRGNVSSTWEGLPHRRVGWHRAGHGGAARLRWECARRGRRCGWRGAEPRPDPAAGQPGATAALMIRDRICQYPSCAQTRHLQAHHVVPWAAGGRTDLEDLILLCQWHHTTVHEGGVRIESRPNGWHFMLPDGTAPKPWQSDGTLARMLAAQARRHADAMAGVDRFDHPAAAVIRPGWAGERFSLHDCVQALFAIRRPVVRDAA